MTEHTRSTRWGSLLSLVERRRLVGVLAVGALAVAGAGSVGASERRPSGDLTLYADFVDAGAILEGSDVKVDGLPAGKVTDVALHEGRARLTLSVDRRFTPLHRDATAEIRPVSLLGERFVDLDRGSPDSPALADGAVLPVAQTRRSVDLDEVLNAVDQPTGAALAALVSALGDGVAGRGEDVSAVVAALAPSLERTRPLVALLDEQNALLGSLIDRLEPVASSLAGDRGRELDRVVAAGTALLETTAASRSDLSTTLARLPGTLGAAERALRELDGTAVEATDLLVSLRPVTEALAEVSREVSALSAAADPALDSLDPVLAKASAVLEEARPVTGELAAASGDLQASVEDARQAFEVVEPDLDAVLDWVRNWALITNGRDAASHYIRAFFVGNPQQVGGTGLLPGGAPDVPPFSGGDAADLPEVPVPSVPVPPLSDIGPVPLPETVPEDDEAASPSATGLTVEQERSLLGFLTGGGGR